MKRYFFVFLMTLFTFSLLMQDAAAAEIVTAHAIEDCNNYISDGIVPYASLYLKAQKAWCSTSSGGKIEIHFQVTAKSRMSSVGAKDIYVYEKRNGAWVEVKHYSSSSTTGMLKSNTSFCDSSVTFTGTIGKEYKAIVTAYAGNSSSESDSIDVETSAVTAKR